MEGKIDKKRSSARGLICVININKHLRYSDKYKMQYFKSEN